MNKYKLTKTTKEVYGITLYQIKALKDFSDVKKGDLGGWIDKENNLSQNSNAWVSGNARVYGDAWVFGNAEVYNLKLKGGYFYHYKQKTEEVEKVEVDEDYELLAKDPVLGEEEKPKEDMVEIKVEGKTKKISRTSAKELNLID